jgi:hypothetical protein
MAEGQQTGAMVVAYYLLSDRFAPEAAGREAFGQHLRPHPKNEKPSCQRLAHGEQLRSKFGHLGSRHT